MLRRFGIVILFLALLLCKSLANQSTRPTQVNAPKITTCQSLGEQDLGSWDEVFNYPAQDFILLRRGPDLFSHSFMSSGPPRKLATIPALVDSKIVNGVEVNGHRWLLIQSAAGMPF